MSILDLERVVLSEARIVTGNKKLKMKDIVEWSTGKINARAGEKLYQLPRLSVTIAVKE